MMEAIKPHMETFEEMEAHSKRHSNMTEAHKMSLMTEAQTAMGAVFDALLDVMCKYSETLSCAGSAKECDMDSEEGEGEEDMMGDMLGELEPMAPCICGPCG